MPDSLHAFDCSGPGVITTVHPLSRRSVSPPGFKSEQRRSDCDGREQYPRTGSDRSGNRHVLILPVALPQLISTFSTLAAKGWYCIAPVGPGHASVPLPAA